MRAHIHHKDGNPLNNPIDGSNWQVLCRDCHRKLPKRKEYNLTGMTFAVFFSHWKYDEILQSRDCKCESCGSIFQPYKKREILYCTICNQRITNKRNAFSCDLKGTIHRECFPKWQEELSQGALLPDI